MQFTYTRSCTYVPFLQLNLLQLVLSASVAAVKCRPVLHHCVVIFFSGPQGPLTVCLFTFENDVPLILHTKQLC